MFFDDVGAYLHTVWLRILQSKCEKIIHEVRDFWI